MKSESDVEAYFARVSTGTYSRLHQLEINLLEQTAAQSLTEDFSFHPLVRHLDGLLLDDPSTSNHHVLLRRHPFEGHVLYLAHDDNSRIVFPSLARLLDAADEAKASGLFLAELHPSLSPNVVDQAAVSHLVRSLVDGAEEEVDAALALIPSMDLSDIDLLVKLAEHEDFYVSEAVGAEIAKRPSGTLRSVALLCTRHTHPQAAQSGAKALRAIDA
jgi:hypothetical protein